MKFLEELVLASSSPRRAEILTAAGWDFVKDVSEIDESVIENELPQAYVERLAERKAAVVAVRYPGQIVLGADTTVVIDDQIIGKPVDHDDAVRMIKLLADRTHLVITGVAIIKDDQHLVASQTTEVTFGPMTAKEIEFLAAEGSPLDKAGGYAVQAQAALFITGIKGDYWNVVGLPINLVYDLVNKLK